MKTVIIGGVAGGASAAARLRRLDEQAEIVILERGGFISFANCGLPYYIGNEIDDRNNLMLQTPESFKARFNVDTRVFSEVEGIDCANKTVKVKNLSTGVEYDEPYDKLILSPGAKPFVPPLEGADNGKVFTLRTIPDAVAIKTYIENESPASVAVIGGGNIGIEMSENLVLAGLHVTIIEMADHVIAPLDHDMACQVHNYLRHKGIDLRLSTVVEAIHDKGGKLSLALGGSKGGELTVDMAILSAGVKPDTGFIGSAGIALGRTGAIIVDDAMLTSDKNIYAVGDAVEFPEFVTGQSRNIQLAGPANKQGRIAADNICGLHSTYKGTQGSSVTKVFDMTVATTGISETEAKRQLMDYDKVFTLSPSNASYYPGGREISVKTVFEKSTGKILGAQLVGYKGVDKRCDVFAVAIRAGMTASDLTELELCYAPPFSSAKDPVNFAGYVASNVIKGVVKTFHWHDVDALPRDGSVQLLDVRTPAEYGAGHIDGFVNIEVDALRENLARLDKSKPVYVHCRSGQRSYIACRILTQNGFDCFNLSGGYWLYNEVKNGAGS